MLGNILVVLWGILAIAAFLNMAITDNNYRKGMTKEEAIFAIVLIAPLVLIGIVFGFTFY